MLQAGHRLGHQHAGAARIVVYVQAVLPLIARAIAAPIIVVMVTVVPMMMVPVMMVMAVMCVVFIANHVGVNQEA